MYDDLYDIYDDFYSLYTEIYDDFYSLLFALYSGCRFQNTEWLMKTVCNKVGLKNNQLLKLQNNLRPQADLQFGVSGKQNAERDANLLR